MNALQSSRPMVAPPQIGCVFVTGVWKSGNHLIYSALNQLGVEGPLNGFAAHLLFGQSKVSKRMLRGALPTGAAVDVGLETEVFIRPGYPFDQVLTRAEGCLTAPTVLQVPFEDLVGPNGAGSPARQKMTLAALCDNLNLTSPAGPAWAERIYGRSLTSNKGWINRWREPESRDLRDEIEERLATHLVTWCYAADVEARHDARLFPRVDDQCFT